MMVLHEHAMDRKIRDMKFSAAIHGVDPKELEGKEISQKTMKDNLLFGDPEEYKKMGEQERKDLSEKMMKKFTKWAKVK